MSDNLKFDESTNTLTVADVDGVDYLIGSRVVSGEVKLTKNTTVVARPAPGKKFAKGTETEFRFEVNKDVAEKDRSDSVEKALAEQEETNKPAKPADPVVTQVQPSGDAARGAGTPAGTTPAPPNTGGPGGTTSGRP